MTTGVVVDVQWWRVNRAEAARMHELRDGDGLSATEIARLTGRSRPTVRRVLNMRVEDVREGGMTHAPPDPSASTRTRRGRAELRAAVLAGRTPLEDVLRDPFVADVAIVDLVRWQYARSGQSAMEKLGRAAIADNVNLLLRAGSASARTRAWVAEHGQRARPTGAWRREVAEARAVAEEALG